MYGNEKYLHKVSFSKLSSVSFPHKETTQDLLVFALEDESDLQLP